MEDNLSVKGMGSPLRRAGLNCNRFAAIFASSWKISRPDSTNAVSTSPIHLFEPVKSRSHSTDLLSVLDNARHLFE